MFDAVLTAHPRRAHDGGRRRRAPAPRARLASFDAPYTDRGPVGSHSRYGVGCVAVEDVVGGHVDEVGVGTVARLGDPADGERVGREGALGVALAGIDGGPRGAVDDGIGPPRRDGAEHGVAVGHVEGGVVEPDHVVAGRRRGEHDVVAELPPGPRHQQPHRCSGPHWPVRAYLASVAAFCGRHHASCSRYHSIVAASPAAKSRYRGRQPSSVRSLVQSMA